MVGESSRRENLCDQVVANLLHSLKTSTIVPGERLPTEPELAKQFNVSRTVIREAVGKLRALNIVTVRQGDGTYVNPVNLSNLLEPLLPLINLSGAEEQEIMETRLFLEPGVVKTCALRVQNHGKEQFGKIEQTLELMHGSMHRDNIFDYSKNEISLKLHMADFSLNSLLTGFMSLVVPLAERQIQLVNEQPSMLAKSFDVYTKIVKAVAGGDEMLAMMLMRGLLVESRSILQEI